MPPKTSLFGEKTMRNIEQESPATVGCNSRCSPAAGRPGLEKDARRKLEDRFGVKLSFAKELQGGKGVAHVR